MITKLTPDQTARFGEWAQKWIEIGLSTEPADFERATAAALRAYDLCNLQRPIIVLRMGSPYGATLGGTLAWAILRELGDKKVQDLACGQVWRHVMNQVQSQVTNQICGQVVSQVGSQIWRQVWSQVENQVGRHTWSQVGNQVKREVRSQIWSQIRSQIWSQIRSQVVNQVRNQVERQIRSQVGSQVWSQVESQVGSQVGSQVWSTIYNNRGGAFWAGWGAYVSFLRDVVGWADPVLDRFQIDEDLIRSCGWVWWHENVLAISDRPETLHRDDAGRLHCETGPSIRYRDGWSLWHWHGTAVPEAWITNKASLTAATALRWENIEQRRAACEIVGWHRILAELNAQTIDRDADPQIGELVEVSLPDAGKERFLRVMCGTGREFAIPVPREMRTALQANAWTYSIPENLLQTKEYRT